MNPLKTHFDQLLVQGYELKIQQYLSRAWQIFKKEPAFFIGFMFVNVFISLLASVIPVLGNFLSIIFAPVLAIAPAIVAQKIDKGQPYVFNNFFDGFQKFVPLLLAYLIMVGIIIVLALVCIGVPLALSDNLQDLATINPQNLEEMQVLLNNKSLILGAGVFMVGAVFVSVLYFFAPYFVWFHDFSATDALKASQLLAQKNFWGIVLFFLTTFLLNFLGLLALCIGILITAPVSYIAQYCLFEDVVGTQFKNDLNDTPQDLE